MYQNFIKCVGYGNKGYSLLLKDKKIKNLILISGSNSNYSYIQNKLFKIIKKKAKHIILKENRHDLNYLEKIYSINLNKTNTIIALGGGSIIDFSKRLVLRLRRRKKINFYVIPSILGSGAESSISSIINTPLGKKSFIVNEEFLPDGIIYDEYLFNSLNKIRILMGILDAFCHCLESLTSINKNQYLDFLSVQTLNTFIKNNPINNLLNKNQFNFNEISSLSLNGGLAQSNSGSGICHALTHASEKILNINHSEGISYFINPVFKYLLINNKKDLKELNKKLCKYIFKLNKYLNEKKNFKIIKKSMKKKVLLKI